MYHSRKIGVFISHIMGHYQKHVCQGIIDKALEYGYTAEIFTTLDGENLGEYGIGEKSILNLPDYDDYSGIIFAADTYPAKELKSQILSSLQESCTCPVIEIAAANQHFPAVTLENNSMTADLVRHLCNVHHYKRICYLGCSDQAYFSDSREQFYRSAMNELHLNVGEKDVYACSIDDISIKEALDYFVSDGKVPEAVVCYNDDVALLFIQVAKEAGYRIPEDIAITGCDHTAHGQNTIPALTTVTFPVYDLGVCAITQLLKLIRKEPVDALTFVSAAPIYHSSCGCQEKSAPDVFSFQQLQSRQIASLESSILSSMRMSAAFSCIKDLDEGIDLLENHIRNIAHCKEFYLCLYSGWDSVSSYIQELTMQEDTTCDSDEILLKLAIRDGKRLPEYSFKRTAVNGLLPEHIYQQSDSAYIYTPLFFEDKCFGYVALSYEDNRIDYHFQLVHWFLNINQMLHGICETRCNTLLLHHLEDFYSKDSLTGLYNKHGYLQRAEHLIARASRQKETVTCFLFDLDHLKQINDTYGHAEGDFAIQVIGQALLHVIKPEDICARFSGDEFYLLTSGYSKKDADDLLAHVSKYLSNYNHLCTKAYTISVSGGYASSTAFTGFSISDIDALFALADQNMYQQKRARYRA
ncbi:MAG: GGDEF domain-containing protein [Clostridiales bacterium]|nr:GGDEF domain-containing protein [Roseburia sp.]MDD7635973.1 GGDEF domain-containing protein [Clostridiales bacterium]MDY4111833.1 GGDEF domain-containing protein [Roseburia sp.]